MSITINGSTGIAASNIQGIIDLAITGNTTLGDASADLVTINGGTINVAASGARITGDFSNATIANRTMFQSSTINGNTLVSTLPNGSSTASGLLFYNGSDSSNSAWGGVYIDSNATYFSSTKNGTGTNVPIVFQTSGTERLRIDTSGNINIATAGARITGDFSNATVANRVAFQSNVTNGFTQISLIPNGTGVISGHQYRNSSDASNYGQFLARITDTEAQLSSSITGTGTYVPITFYTGGSERLRIDTSGNIIVGSNGTSLNIGCNSAMGDYAGSIKSALEFSSAATNFPYIDFHASNTWQDYNARIACSGSAAGLGAGDLGYYAGQHIFVISGTEKVRIDTNGNVGIGLGGVSPGTRLDVAGGYEWNIRNVTTSDTATARSHFLTIKKRTTGAVQNSDMLGGLAIGGYYDATNYAYGWNGGAEITAYAGENWTSTNRGAYLTFLTTPNTTGASIERMRISDVGNISIGGQLAADTSGRFLDIINAGASAGAYSIVRLITQQSASTTTTSCDLVKYKNGQFAINNYDASGIISFGTGTSGTERVRIGSSGEIGIGGANYGTSGQVLTSSGTGAAPTWSTVTGSGVGIGQTWTDVTASRASGTTYTNSTGKPILVSVWATTTSASPTAYTIATVAGVIVAKNYYSLYQLTSTTIVGGDSVFIVPNGATYSVTCSASLSGWVELR